MSPVTEPMELPVVTPGVEEATRKMRDFHGAIMQSAEAAQQHVRQQQEVGQNLQETGRHTESLTGKFRELGSELRHSAPELGHLIRDLTGTFAGIGLGVEVGKKLGEAFFDALSQGARDAAEDVKNLREAMAQAQEVVGGSKNKLEAQGMAGLKKGGATLQGLVGMGGDSLVAFSEDLANKTGIDVGRVNDAVLKAKQAGLSDVETTNVIKASALLEQTGHGKFEAAAASGANLGKFSKRSVEHPEDDTGLLFGSAADVASRLANEKSVEAWASDDSISGRRAQTGAGRTRVHQEKDAWSRKISELQAKGMWDEARAMSDAGYHGIEGGDRRFAGKYNPDLDHGARGTSMEDLRVQQLHMRESRTGAAVQSANRWSADESVEEQSNAIERGSTGAKASYVKTTMEQTYPGAEEQIQALLKLVKKHRGEEQDYNNGGKGFLESMGHFGESLPALFGGKTGYENLRDKHLSEEQAAVKAMGLPNDILGTISNTLKSIDNKLRPSTSEAAPK